MRFTDAFKVENHLKKKSSSSRKTCAALLTWAEENPAAILTINLLIKTFQIKKKKKKNSSLSKKFGVRENERKWYPEGKKQRSEAGDVEDGVVRFCFVSCLELVPDGVRRHGETFKECDFGHSPTPAY